MKRKICELLLIIVFYVLQCTAGRVLAIGGISPNFLIIIPVLFGFLNGKTEGIYTGFECGIIYDLFSYSIIGLSSIAMMFIGYFAGCFYQKYEEKEFLMPIAMVGAGDFIYGFLSYVVNFLLHNKLDVLYYLKRFIMPEVVYTVIVTIAIYRIIVFLNRHFEGKERKRAIEYDQGNI